MDVERHAIERIARMNMDELAKALVREEPEEQRALRRYFGGEPYEELRALAGTPASRESLGNVVVLPGVMGSHLETLEASGDGDWIWVNPARIVLGQLERLRLAVDGNEPSDSAYLARPANVIQYFYAGLALRLRQRWNVECFPFDWRKDLAVWAAELRKFIDCTFGANQPVHLVAHSQGGLLARTYIRDYSPRWETMWGGAGSSRQGGRLIMLGTPNHGSFAIVQMMAGLHGVIRILDAADVTHDRRDLLDIALTFPAPYQHLPSPEPPHDPVYERLFATAPWDDHPVRAHHLDAARKHIRTLGSVVNADRMRYVAGANRQTPTGIKRRADGSWGPLHSRDSYDYTPRGDGTVTHDRGRLVAADGRTVPMFYINEAHANLPRNSRVQDAVDTLLETGWCDLPLEPPAPEDERQTVQRTAEADVVLAEVLASRLRSRLVDARAASRMETGDREEVWPLPREFDEEEHDLMTLIAAYALSL